MAFSAVTERDTANHKTSQTTVAVTLTGSSIVTGRIVFAYCGTDNTPTTSGAATNHDTVADSDGNTWNKVFERARSAGGVADGAQHSLWWALVTNEIEVGDTVTLTMDTARTAKVIGLFTVTVGAGSTIELADGTSIQHFEDLFNNPSALSTSGMTNEEHLHLGLITKEDSVLTWAEDANFTNVFAAEGYQTTGSTAPSNITSHVAYRISTSTGETWDPGAISSGNRDACMTLVAFREVTSGPTTHEGTGSSSVAVTAAATGEPTHEGTGSSSIAVTTSATGDFAHTETGASSVIVTTSATGEFAHTETGSSSVVVTTSAEGERTAARAGSSSIVVTASATGEPTHKATGSSSVVVTTTATGEATHFATGSSNVVVTATATGEPTHKGTGSSAVVVTTTATGEPTRKATGSSNVVVTTTGFGVVEGNNQGAGSSSIVVSTTATGKRTAKGQGSCAVVVTSSATGKRRAHRTGSSSLVVTCSASGEAFRAGTGAVLIVVSATGAGQSDATTIPIWPVSTHAGWETEEGVGWPVSTNPEWEVV